MKKKVIAVLCGLCLIGSMLPMGTVYAEEKNGGLVTEQQGGINELENIPLAGVSDGVAIDEANFPDTNFRTYVAQFDTNGDGIFSQDELDAVTQMQVTSGMGGDAIRDIKGIQYFTNLQILRVNTACTNLDLSQNVNLKELNISGAALNSLDLSNNTALTILKIQSATVDRIDGLASLDLSNCTALTDLELFTPLLTHLDLSNNVAIRRLRCTISAPTLDLSKNTSLTDVSCTSIGVPAAAYASNGKWVIDLSKIVSAGDLGKIETGIGTYDPATGLWTLPDVFRLADVKYTFHTGAPVNEQMAVSVKMRYDGTPFTVDTNVSEVKVDASGIDLAGICEAFGINQETSDVEILIRQGINPSSETESYFTETANNDGNTPLKSYYVETIVFQDGKGLYAIQDRLPENIGNVTLSFYAGKEYAGKRATVYQINSLENSQAILYKDLKIDENGMAAISGSNMKYKYFGVALQNSTSTPEGGTGTTPDSGTDVTAKADTNESQVKAEVGGIDMAGICKDHGIDPEASDVEILVQQKKSAEKNAAYLAGIAAKAGDTILNTYDVEMLLNADGKSYGLVTDNFGNLILTLYAGKEHAGKTAAVYQLHGENEVIPHKDLKIDENGMVKITVTKLSTFAVALQKNTTTPGQEPITSPKTGDYSNMIPWMAAMVLSLGALVLIATRKIRKVKR